MIVGIVASQCGHAQHLAGVDIHDDAEGAVEHIILFDGLLQVLLQIVLHRHIQGQNQGIAVGSVVVFFIGIEHLGAAVSLGGDDRAGVSREGGVVVGLQAFAAHVVRIHKAQHLGGHGAVGIVAPGVELQIDDAGELIVIDELAHLLRRLLGHLALDGAVVILGLGGLLPDKVRVHLQKVREPRGDEVDGHRRIIFLPRLPLFILGLDAALQIVGIDENGLHRGRGGQNVHIAVVDHAPGRGESGASGLVANGHLLILVVIDNHQLVERGHQGDEEDNAAENQQNKRAPQHQPVRPFPRVSLLPFPPGKGTDVVSCHGLILSAARRLPMKKGGGDSAAPPGTVYGFSGQVFHQSPGAPLNGLDDALEDIGAF